MSTSLRALLAQQKEDLAKSNQPALGVGGFLNRNRHLSPLNQKRAKTSMETVLAKDMDPHGNGSSLLRPTSAPLVDPELIKDDQFSRRRLQKQKQQQMEQDAEEQANANGNESLIVESVESSPHHQNGRLPPLPQRPASASKSTQIYTSAASAGTETDRGRATQHGAAVTPELPPLEHPHHSKGKHKVSLLAPPGDDEAKDGTHAILKSPCAPRPASPKAEEHSQAPSAFPALSEGPSSTEAKTTTGTESLPIASTMKLEKQFHALDLNGDGVLDVHEVTVALKKSFPSADKETLLRLSETMTSGADDRKIDLEEFISYFARHQADRLASVENLRQRSNTFLGAGFREDPLSHLSPAQVEELVTSFTTYNPEQFEHCHLNRDEVEQQVKSVFGAATSELQADLVEVLFETAERTEGFHGIRIDPSLFFKMFVEEAAATAAKTTTGTETLPIASTMKLEKQFHALDLNGDGVLDVHEVTVALKKSFPSADKETLLRLSEKMTSGADSNADGKIDLQEFISYFARHQADRLASVENLRQRSNTFLVAAPAGSGFREDPLSHLSPAQVEELVKSFTHYNPEQFEHRHLNRDEVEQQVKSVFGAATSEVQDDLIEVLFETAERTEGFHGIRIDPSLFFKMFVEEAASMAAALGDDGMGVAVASHHNPTVRSPVEEAARGGHHVTVREELDPSHPKQGHHVTIAAAPTDILITIPDDSRQLSASLDSAIRALHQTDLSGLSMEEQQKVERLRSLCGGRSKSITVEVPSTLGSIPATGDGRTPQASPKIRAMPISPLNIRLHSEQSLNISGREGGENQPLERKQSTLVSTTNLDDRVALLFSKLRLISKAPKVYKDMVESKECVVRVNEFAIECSKHLRGSDVLQYVETALSSAAGAESATLLLSSATGLVLDRQERDTGLTREELIEMINGGEPLYLDQRYIFPLASENTYIGVIQVHFDQEHPAPNRDSRVFKRALLGGMASVAAMTIQNFFSFREANFHREKAEAMLRMAKQLSMDNLEEDVLVHSIMNSAKELINANRCSVFLVSADPVNKGTLTAYFEGSGKVTLPAGTGIAGHVAQTRETVNIPDCYSDSRFNAEIDKKTGYKTTTMLCMPVEYEGTVVGVTQLVNKENGEPFNHRDEDLFSTFSTFVAVCLRNCRVHQELTIEKRKSEAILTVAEEVSECDIRDVQKVANHVLKGAKDLLGADRATLFLVDDERNELYSKIADGTSGESEIRFPVGKGIAGIAAEKNKPENIRDAYADPRFNKEYDQQLGYHTQSILTQPISHGGEVLAVAQLVNKLDKQGKPHSFTEFDEQAFHTFSLFAGISLSNSRLLEFAVKAGQEAMALHSLDGPGSPGSPKRRSSVIIADGVNSAMVGQLQGFAIEEQYLKASLTKDFDIWSFRDAYAETESTLTQRTINRTSDAAVSFLTKMIMSTGLPELFDCEESVLCRFIASCRSKYRNVPYHNFYHAVDVCQTICAYIHDGKLQQLLPPLQQFILIITALVHDLDHMGVNNSFHLKTDSPLGMLSSASGNNSVLEVHHCNVAIAILDDPNKNVFAGLEKEELKTAFKEMIECVLATDMARHAGLMEEFTTLTDKAAESEEVAQGEGESQAQDLLLHKGVVDTSESRVLAMQVVLKAADISNVTKQFDISRKWGMAVTEEFYRQGDAERAKGVEVLAMFDRSARNELAKGQLGFIDFVAAPFFTKVVRAFPTLKWLTDNIDNNKSRWKAVLAERRESAQAKMSVSSFEKQESLDK